MILFRNYQLEDEDEDFGVHSPRIFNALPFINNGRRDVINFYCQSKWLFSFKEFYK
jgi:hypothetical protein